MKYDHYAKICNRYCIAYGGHCPEYLVQLRLLMPSLEKEFPDVKIHLAARDDFLHLFKGHKRVIPYSQIRERKREFGYVRELVTGNRHPVWLLLKESDIKPSIEIPNITNGNRLCVITTKAAQPTKPMNERQISQYTAEATYSGYQVWVDPSKGALESAGWVIGVENEILFEAAGMGIKTSLVPNGIGTQLYQLMFPKGEVLKNTSR